LTFPTNRRMTLKAAPALILATCLSLTACKQNPTAPDTDASANAAILPEANVSLAIPNPAVTAPDFVNAVAISDMFEIAASKLALEKAKNPAIKTFAEQMIKDHGATTAEVKQIIAKDTLEQPPSKLDLDHDTMIADLKAAEPEDFDALYLDQQRKAHQSALNLLQGYAVNGDNADLKGFASETAPKVQHHLQMVNDLDEKGADEPTG